LHVTSSVISLNVCAAFMSTWYVWPFTCAVPVLHSVSINPSMPCCAVDELSDDVAVQLSRSSSAGAVPYTFSSAIDHQFDDDVPV
jgi:hypothetical protein